LSPAAATATRELRRQYVKLCDVRDFDDPLVRDRIREIEPELEPRAELHRKYWEYALLTLFMEDVGRLGPDTEALSVAAGHEDVLFWLTNHVGKVVATDIYGAGAFAEREAEATMLENPAAFAPYRFRADRLEVRQMNALRLEFPDESFDVVFSLNSIEHFGGRREIVQAAREMARVLRPGGYAFVVTECFISRHPLNSRLLQTAVRTATLGRLCRIATPRRRIIDVMTREEVMSRVVRGSGLTLVQRPDFTVSPESADNLVHFGGDGTLTPKTGEPWPHVQLEVYGAPWTSIALALAKPAG
jgi:ubiquinone/menaquinone biosynthesis C-methylase UbiE